MVNDSFSLRGFSNLHDYHSNLLDLSYAVHEHVVNRREFALITESPKNDLDKDIIDVLRGRGLNRTVCRIDTDSTASYAISRISATRRIPVMRIAHRLERNGALRALRLYSENFNLSPKDEIALLQECVLIFGENLNSPAMFVLLTDSGCSSRVVDALGAVCRDADIAMIYPRSFSSLSKLRDHLSNYVKYI